MAKRRAGDDGVPAVYCGENGKFKPGMDARYMSDLIAAVIGVDEPNVLMAFDPVDAVERLRQRGWMHHLAMRRQAVMRRGGRLALAS